MSNTTFISEEGNIRIADDVFCSIVAIVATETQGVAGMSSNLVDGLANFLGRKSLAQGVKVQTTEDQTISIAIYVIVEYGYRIPDIALRLQERIKTTVERMTDYKVTGVDVFVQRIIFDAPKDTTNTVS